jgi:predicted nucleotidyltransferase
VFGSFARCDATEDSDVDLLIEAGPRTPPWFPGGLLVDLDSPIPQSQPIFRFPPATYRYSGTFSPARLL